jgi:flagellar hook-length control protein FliK
MTIAFATISNPAVHGRADASKDGAPVRPAADPAAAAPVDAGAVASVVAGAPIAQPANDGRMDFLALLHGGIGGTGADRADADASASTDAPAEGDAPRAHGDAPADAGDAAPVAALALPVLPALAMPMTLPIVATWHPAAGDDGAADSSKVTGATTQRATLPLADGAVDAGAAPAPARSAAQAGARAEVSDAADAPAAAATRQPPVSSQAQVHVHAAAAAPADSDTRSPAPAASNPQPASLAQAFAAAQPAAQPAAAQALALHGTDPAQWRESLRDALGDRLQVQVADRSERAVIRLDPPALGRIEIVISHQAGNLQVHLSASNGDVLRQLHTIGDSLRQDLVHRQYGDVAVVVSDARGEGGGQGRDRDTQAESDTPGRALGDAEGAADSGAFAFLQDRE